jgi:hypothetical protein
MAREAPEILVLPPRPGAVSSAAAPVRIFLGTEPAQHRAERVFVWSIERLRDPGRRYEIHLMKSLTGFRTTGWTTGFHELSVRRPVLSPAPRDARSTTTSIRSYLRDPAELFDLSSASTASSRSLRTTSR